MGEDAWGGGDRAGTGVCAGELPEAPKRAGMKEFEKDLDRYLRERGLTKRRRQFNPQAPAMRTMRSGE